MNEEKKKEPLLTYSVRLTRDQVAFLKSIKDAGAFIREALDVAILAYSNKPKEHEVIALNQRIGQLQKRIERIKGSEEYRNIMARWDDDRMFKFRLQLQRYKNAVPLHQAIEKLRAEPFPDEHGGTEHRIFDPGNPESYIVIKDFPMPDEALKQGKREIEETFHLGIDAKMKEEYEFLKKAKQAYDEEIARLEKEIQELRAKVIQ